MRGLRFLGATALVVVALSTVGCAKLTEKFKPAPDVVVIAPKVASLDATHTGVVLTYLPTDVPRWPGSHAEKVAQAQTPQGQSWTALFTTPDSYDAVVEGFAAGLKDAGWSSEVADVGDATDQASLITASNDRADALFTITRSADSTATQIDVVVTPK